MKDRWKPKTKLTRLSSGLAVSREQAIYLYGVADFLNPRNTPRGLFGGRSLIFRFDLASEVGCVSNKRNRYAGDRTKDNGLAYLKFYLLPPEL